MSDRIARLNIIALGVALYYALVAIQFISDLGTEQSPGVPGSVVNPAVDLAFIYVTSAGLYLAIVKAILAAVSNSSLLLRLYWGRRYVDGLWSYVYTIDGDESGTKHFGIWRFRQDLYRTTVVGFGLTDDFEIRSRVRSLTDLVEHNLEMEVVNVRTDSIDSKTENYSRTTMYFEVPRKGFMKVPNRMTGKTFVYGGPLTGRICSNTFYRQTDVATEEELIERLKSAAVESRDITPAHPRQYTSTPR